MEFEPTVDTPKQDMEKGHKRLSTVNPCSFDVSVGVIGSEGGAAHGLCPENEVGNHEERCFWNLDGAPGTLALSNSFLKRAENRGHRHTRYFSLVDIIMIVRN